MLRFIVLSLLIVLTGCQKTTITPEQKNQQAIAQIMAEKYSVTQVKGEGIQPRQYIVCGDEDHPCRLSDGSLPEQPKPFSVKQTVVEDCQPCVYCQ